MGIWRIGVMSDNDSNPRSILVEADTQEEAESIAIDNYYYPIGRASEVQEPFTQTEMTPDVIKSPWNLLL